MTTQFNIKYTFQKLGYTKVSNTWHIDNTTTDIFQAFKWYQCGSRVDVVKEYYSYNGHTFAQYETTMEYGKSLEKLNLARPLTLKYLTTLDDVNNARDKQVKHSIYNKLVKAETLYHKDASEQQKAIERIKAYEGFLQGVALGNTSYK